MQKIISMVLTAPIPVGYYIYAFTNNRTVLDIVLFIYSATYFFVEIYKLSFGKKTIDDSKGLAKFLFFRLGMFYKESILNAKGKKLFYAWLAFLFSIAFLTSFIIFMFVL